MNEIRQAEFEVRDRCITCGSRKLKTLSEGRFTDKPLFDFLSDDPFGEDPLPHLQDSSWCFVQCEDCGQKFHQNVLNEEWNSIYYNRWISSEAIAEHLCNLGHLGFKADFEKGKHAVERILQIERLTRSLRGSDPIRILDLAVEKESSFQPRQVSVLSVSVSSSRQPVIRQR